MLESLNAQVVSHKTKGLSSCINFRFTAWKRDVCLLEMRMQLKFSAFTGNSFPSPTCGTIFVRDT